MKTDTSPRKTKATRDSIGSAKNYLSSRNQSWWVNRGLLFAGACALVAVLNGIFSEADPGRGVALPSENQQIMMFANIDHPLAALSQEEEAAMNEGDSIEALELTYAALERYDFWIKPRLQTAMDDAIAREALRMQEFARKEAANGQYTTTDAVGTFDFSACLTNLSGDLCVLLRYAGEGLAEYAKGAEENDPYAMSAGYLRFRAALLATGDFEVSSREKQDLPSNALSNYRQVIYTALKYSPAARAGLRFTLPNTYGSTTPGEQLEETYSTEKSSEATEVK